MIVSYKWLQQYFEEKLPPVDKVVEILTMNSSEVDGVKKVDGDYILDVKILPNMAHSCLCHRGIARELSVLLGWPMKKYSREFKVADEKVSQSGLNLQIKIENPKDCRRYVGRVIEGIKISSSPDWLRNRLEILGQRSINNLVDATNFVMLELGQPMHVFDCDKVGGSLIEIKKAKTGDEIKTLDGKDLVLDDSVLTISNNSKALAIAGIKGGTLAEIGPETKNIILESANFDPVLIRKTAQKLKIQTEASKRYENEITAELCAEAMTLLTDLILEIAGTEESKVGEMVDIYPLPAKKFNLGLSPKDVSRVLGVEISQGEIEKIFQRFGFTYNQDGDQLIVQVPAERLDLRIKEDLIEEVGRVYGYDKLKEKEIVSVEKGKINKTFYYSNKVKQILVDQGFSEIYGYAFSDKGEIELANSVAPDKKFLRQDLTTDMIKYLEFNSRYCELVDMPQIKIFEIGKVFRKNDEHNNLVIGVKGSKTDAHILEEAVSVLEEKLGIKLSSGKEGNIFEINFDELVATLPEPKSYDVTLPMVDKEMRFKKISIYPFSVRDVAVFVPESTDVREVEAIIKREAGDLLTKIRLFDVFTKKSPDGTAKTSFAFRLVLQAYDRTLAEEEITGTMAKITASLNAQKDWQVR